LIHAFVTLGNNFLLCEGTHVHVSEREGKEMREGEVTTVRSTKTFDI